MNATLGILRAGERTAAAIAAHSRAALDRPLTHPAELWVAISTDDAVLTGAFQRRVEGVDVTTSGKPLRRGSGGPAVRVGEGTVHVALALAHPGALVPCDAKRIVNRSVRPLLRALTKTLSTVGGKSGLLAHHFGRDWVSVAHRPAAWVGFAHDATTQRTVFEAVVAVRTPFALCERASFLGKAQGTLEGLAGRPVDAAALARAIADAYAEGHANAAIDQGSLADPDSDADPAARLDDDADPPWAATVDEAIGLVGAGPDARGVFRVGGDWLVSRDAVARLETGLTGLAIDLAGDDLAALGALIDATLGAAGVALEGVKTLASVRDVIDRARRSAPSGS